MNSHNEIIERRLLDCLHSALVDGDQREIERARSALRRFYRSIGMHP